MELGRGRGRRGRLVATARAPSLLCVSFCCCCFFFFFFFCACALFADAGRSPAHPATGISFGRGKSSPEQCATAAAAAAEERLWRRRTAAAAAATRRYLVGPGSYPPRCASKCGDCTPCKPVHVPVPPGAPVMITEYYPEAWRCNCGGKLYMP